MIARVRRGADDDSDALTNKPIMIKILNLSKC